MPNENWNKFSKESKWSGDQDYLERFNYFLGVTSVDLATVWDNPEKLLVILHSMEQAWLDVEPLAGEDERKVIQKRFRDLEERIIKTLPTAISLKVKGFPGQFLALKRDVTELFTTVRETAHHCGLTLKVAFSGTDVVSELKNKIRLPTL